MRLQASLILTGILLFVSSSCGREDSISVSSTQAAHAVITELYQEVLNRPPDPSGLHHHTELMLLEGKDNHWLRRALYRSPEAKQLRTVRRWQRMRISAVAFIVVAGAVASCFHRAIWGRARPRIARLMPEASRAYLAGSVRLPPIAVILIALHFYVFIQSGPPQGWIVTGLTALLLLVAMRTPRGLLYATLAMALGAMVGWCILVDAQGSQDRGSDRDDAVEVTASAVFQGENPWNSRTQLNLPITTGPSSILIALPFVAWTGKVDGLSVLLWYVFFGTVLLADIRRQNNTLITVVMFCLLPSSGFLHTFHWGLDELYYAAILSPALWLALKREKLLIAGALGSFMVLSRLSYAPPVFGAGLWWLFAKPRTLRRDILPIGIGGTLYAAFALAFFWIVGGQDFYHANFWRNAQVSALNTSANPISASIRALLDMLPEGPLGGMLVILPAVAMAAWFMRRNTHPFFHMTLASVLAHTISFSPAFLMDYQLTFLIPALYAFAFSSRFPCRVCAGSDANQWRSRERRGS